MRIMLRATMHRIILREYHFAEKSYAEYHRADCPFSN
jgi:hypothetical protein